ncbi:MAG: AAA family ATPase [Anaplasma sp.]
MESVIGHSTQKRALMENQGVIAWLFCGKRGIGKSKLAYAFARHILKSETLDASPDVMIVESSTEPISVDKVREIKYFLHMTAANSDRKVVILDSIDGLSTNSANAMLKTLEEPPKGSVILLISHNLYGVPIVLRSRCVILQFQELSPEETRLVIEKDIPDISQIGDKASLLYKGTPGMVMTEDIKQEIALYDSLISATRTKSLAPVGDLLETNLPLHKIEHVVLKVMANLVHNALDCDTKSEACNRGNIINMLERYYKVQDLFHTARTMHLHKSATIFRVFEIVIGVG